MIKFSLSSKMNALKSLSFLSLFFDTFIENKATQNEQTKYIKINFQRLLYLLFFLLEVLDGGTARLLGIWHSGILCCCALLLFFFTVFSVLQCQKILAYTRGLVRIIKYAVMQHLGDKYCGYTLAMSRSGTDKRFSMQKLTMLRGHLLGLTQVTIGRMVCVVDAGIICKAFPAAFSDSPENGHFYFQDQQWYPKQMQ